MAQMRLLHRPTFAETATKKNGRVVIHASRFPATFTNLTSLTEFANKQRQSVTQAIQPTTNNITFETQLPGGDFEQANCHHQVEVTVRHR